MVWQAGKGAETGRIYKIGIADDETAFPAAQPITGGDIDWTQTASGEDMEGWTVGAFNFNEDAWEFTNSEGTPIIVKAPASVQQVAIIRDEIPGIPSQIRFTAFEVGSLVAALCSNVTDTAGVMEFDQLLSRQSVIIEIQGLGAHYMPSCEIWMAAPGGGFKNIATQQVVVDIFCGATVTAGYQLIQWQDA
jgi:hypothetical protein